MAVTFQVEVFRVVTPCSVVGGYRRFRGPCCLSKNMKTKIRKTLILPFVLYGCETWPFTLREENI
jgi:hypothetical protein